MKAVSLGPATCSVITGCASMNQVYILKGKMPTYQYIGNYKDDNTLRIPTYVTTVTSVGQAFLIAEALKAPLFGLQNNGMLYIGSDVIAATSLGLTPCVTSPSRQPYYATATGSLACAPPALGDPSANQIYCSRQSKKFNYVGAYNDNSQHMIPLVSNIPITLDNYQSMGQQIANLYGATVFGYQNGTLYLGNDKNLATSLGVATISPLGAPGINQVYSV